MKVEFDPEIRWNGEALSRWATVDGRRLVISLTRDIIHSIPIYNDAIGWEIERYGFDIFERSKPQLLASLSASMNGHHRRTAGERENHVRDEFDERTAANRRSRFQRACQRLPADRQDHDTRKLIAERIIDAARKGHTPWVNLQRPACRRSSN